MKNSATYQATDTINGFECRPGIYTLNGASAMLKAVNFTIHSAYATGCSIVLFRRGETEPYAEIPIPDSYRIGDTWAIMVYGLDIYEIEYCYRFSGEYAPEKGLLFNNKTNILDPYARAVTGQSVWGKRSALSDCYHGRITTDGFDWGNFQKRDIPFSDLVIYEMHVRGFTQSPTSGVWAPGTFLGMAEKIPYLRELGVNAVELMPIFEFDELFEDREYNGKKLLNYWGYNTTCFFAPNTSYTSYPEYNHEGDELKELIRILNENGMMVFLDVVFNHTSEGNEDGSIFSFKGLDNSVWYMLTPEGKYVNFSGCGNTMNCNHPIVRQFIIDCLRYWVIEYRVDGFRFDLASILGRSEDGTPMKDPPLLQAIAYDPILSDCKLIAEAWDAGGLYQVGSFPHWNRWAEWNGRFRDDLRCFLKGDNGMAWAAVQRLTGSADIYPPDMRGHNASVNFLTCHDGFTMYDLYSYNVKHNLENGWNNTDGDNSNTSWNCGVEGETDDPAVNGLRRRMVKNAFLALLCSRGAVMFYAGDEFCNTQFGNNNAYCQDNEISWLDWDRLEKYSEIHDFVRDMIAFRKKHEVIRSRTEPSSFGFPDISVHNTYAWNSNFRDDDHVIGVMFAGKPNGVDDAVFIAFNSYWQECPVELPKLPSGYDWNIDFYTNVEYSKDIDCNAYITRHGNTLRLAPRSSVAATIRKI